MSRGKGLEDRLCWKIPLRAMRAVMTLTCGLTILTIFSSVCMRYVIKSDLFAIEEIITLIAMWLYFISAGYASYEDSHIKADLLTVYVKNKKCIKAIRLFDKGVGIAVLAVFSWWALEFIFWSLQVGGKTMGWKIPLAASQAPLVVGFLLMLVYTVYHFVNILLGREERGKSEWKV